MSTTRIDRIAADIENARNEYDTGLAALQTPDGRSLFAPEEEQRRRNEIQASYQAAQQAAQAALQNAIADAETQIADSTPRDPLAKLTSSELEKAVQLRAFISDDFASLPLAELVVICGDALESNDRARRAVTLRAGKHALASRFSGAGEGHELKQALAALGETFADTAKRDAAQATLDAAGPLQRQMHLTRYLEQAYGPGAVSERRAG